MLRAKITGIASYVPDYVLTNEELSHMVDTNDEWITTRVGIKERRILKGWDRRIWEQSPWSGCLPTPELPKTRWNW